MYYSILSQSIYSSATRNRHLTGIYFVLYIGVFGPPWHNSLWVQKEFKLLVWYTRKIRVSMSTGQNVEKLVATNTLEKPQWPGQISPASNLVLGFRRCSFVAVVASGKSSQVHFAAGLSDPDLTIVRDSAFFFCLDHGRVVCWAPEVIANRPVQPVLRRALQPIFHSVHKYTEDIHEMQNQVIDLWLQGV